MIAICDKEMRLDAFLASRFPGHSRSRIKDCIRRVCVNGNDAPKMSKTVFPGDEVEFDLDFGMLNDRNPDLHSCPVELDVVYDDDEILVINKPQGIPVHHGNGHMSGTVEDSLYFMMDDARRNEMSEFRYGIVHRLDMDTSGLMVIAKTKASAEHLIAQFKSHEVFKEYAALAKGFVPENKKEIITGIRRSAKNRLKFETCAEGEGKLAITEYEVLKYYSDKASFLRVVIRTGRTHQIRVHLESIGNPVLGDILYGSGKTDGMTLMLHAKKIGFDHPSKGHMEFDSELPDRFADAGRDLLAV